MKKNDIFLIVIFIMLGFASLFLCKVAALNGDTVKITVNGVLFAEKPLSQNCTININDTNVVVIENGEVFMQSATCKDKLCMKMGKASDSSKKIICLPNKVIVEITKKSDIDMVVN